jgi:hypothetical protein
MADLLDMSDDSEDDEDGLEGAQDDEEALTEEDEAGVAVTEAQAPQSAPEQQRLAIRDNVLKEILACSWDARTKISPDALQLTSALMRAFVNEVQHRAAAEAAASSASEVTPEHLERILPQLLYDFGP